jgi:hypothetical protein
MAIHTTSSNQLPISHESKNEWSEITPGERFSIRVSSEETNSVYTMLEIVADHRNGTPMHIDQNDMSISSFWKARDTSRRRVARMAAGASYGTAKCSRLD